MLYTNRCMETVFFKPKTIRAFLKSHKEDYDKYDELLIGMALSGLHRADGVAEVLIGFKIKAANYRDLPSKGTTSLELVERIVEQFKDDDTPIDIVIAFDSIESLQEKTNKGVAYQLKRFRRHEDGDGTRPLVNYLSVDIPRKYAPVAAKLLIIPEKMATLDFASVANGLKFSDYPFKSIMFLNVTGENVFIGELWPGAGMNKYKLRELLGD